MTNSSGQALGRETPFQLQALPTTRSVLVSYSDGLSVFVAENKKDFVSRHTLRAPSNASALLKGPSGCRIVRVTDLEITVYDQELQILENQELSQGESLVSLVAVNETLFLTQDETSAVTCWSAESGLSAVGQWMVECTPLFSRGKTVVCAERGRLQERDPKNGTVLRTWPNQATAAWGISDPGGHHALTIDQEGLASIWDMASRELLFSFSTDFQVVRACFQANGLSGALVGLDGEVCRFRLTEGGATHLLAGPEATVVGVEYIDSTLLALDENGGLWELTDTGPVDCGGEWAGWATCCCPLNQSLVIGTATGSLETFDSEGKHSGRSSQLHTDAVVGLESWADGLLSIGADASVCRVLSDGTAERIANYPGRIVVDHALCHQSQALYLALDEGLVTRLSLESGETGEVQLASRIEEIRPAGLNQAAVLTDRGSVKRLRF